MRSQHHQCHMQQVTAKAWCCYPLPAARAELFMAALHRGSRTSSPTRPAYGICLVLPAVQLVTVVEDVFIGGVEAGFHAVLHYLAGTGRAL